MHCFLQPVLQHFWVALQSPSVLHASVQEEFVGNRRLTDNLIAGHVPVQDILND